MGLSLVLVAVLLASSLGGASVTARALARPLAAGTGSSPLATPKPGSSGYLGSVAETLMLYNRTVFSGYFAANSTTYPMQAAFDPENDTFWVGGGNPGTGTKGIDVVDPATDLGVRIVPGGYGSGVAYDNRTNTMWITGGDDDDSVSVYNASTYAFEGTVGTGITPLYDVYDYETNSIFVSNFGNANVTEIGATNLTSWANVEVGAGPGEIGFDPNNGELYTPTTSGENLTVFYQRTGVPHDGISLPSAYEPSWLLVDPENGMVYVASDSPGFVIVNTATNSTVGTVALPGDDTNPYDGMALDPANDSLFVGAYEHNAVAEFAPAPTTADASYQAVTDLATGSDPIGMAFDPTLDSVLVVEQDYSDEASANVTVISAANNAIVGGAPLYNLPYGIAYSSAHHAAYVYDGQSGDLDILNESTLALERTVFVGYTGPNELGFAGFVAYDPVNDTVYVTFRASASVAGDVAVVNASTYVVTDLPSGYFSGPTGVVYDPTNERIFVADADSDQVADFVPGDLLGSLRNISVGSFPLDLVFDSGNDGIYVSNWDSENVSVIHAATGVVIAQHPSTGDEPVGLAYDPADGDIYVANSGAYSLSVISGATNTSEGAIDLGYAAHPEFLTYDPINETVLVSEPAAEAGLPGTQLDFVNATNASGYGYLSIGEDLGPIVWDPDTSAALLSGTYPGAVYEVSTGAIKTPPPPPPTLTVALTAVPSSIELGSTTSLETQVTGATGPLTYVYSTLPSGCSTHNESTLPCTPTATGTFYIGVNVSQAGGGSGAAATELTVTPRSGPLGVTLTAVPSEVRNETPTELLADVTGGVAPFTLLYTGLPSGCASENTSDLSCTPDEVGTFTVTVNVTDNVGATADATAGLSVGWINATLSPVPSTVVLGNASELKTAVGGYPIGPLSFEYRDLPTGCASQNSSELACTPTVTGTFQFHVEVHDSIGDFTNASATLNVSAVPVPLTASVVAQPTRIVLGNPTWFNVTAAGGAPPYSYAYSALPPGCASLNTSSLRCVPAAFGTYTVNANVTDTVGRRASLSATIDVVGALTVTLAVSPGSVSVGADVTFTATVGGVHGSVLTFAYSGLPSGCTSQNATTFSCAPNATGTFSVTVAVHDTDGNSGSAVTSVTVTSSTTTVAPTTTTPFPWTYVAVGAGLLILLLFVLAYRRRRKPPAQTTTPATPAGGTEPPT